MHLLGADQRRFPKATQYIRVELPKVIHVPALASALARVGQIRRARLSLALTWGSRPNIQIVPGLAACGEFDSNVHSHTVRIDETLFRDFEAGRGVAHAAAGRVYVLGVTLLHELVHWGDDRDGIDRAGEEGEEFEKLVYGGVIPC